MEQTSPPVAAVRRSQGRSYLWLSLALLVLGPVFYALQFRAKILSVPWYVPALATAGAILVLLALWRRPTVWRAAVLVLCGLLAGAEWFFLLSVSKVPPYTGPVTVGTPLPEFHATLADGDPFDQGSLRGEQHTALVFFRGRW